MITGKFTWAGKSSDDFKMKMLSQPTFSSPEKDETANSVPGRNGSVFVPNNRMNDISASFSFHAMIVSDFYSTIRRIKNWLLAPDGYQPMIWDGAADLTYYVHLSGASLSFQQLSLTRVLITISATIYPVAYYTNSLNEVSVTNNQVVTNNGLFIAKPKIRLVGSGNAEFAFGASHLVVKNVTDQITVDTLDGTVYDSENNPVYNELVTSTYIDLPTLAVGDNIVTLPDGWTCYMMMRFGEFA
ncbi:MAG: hypothetical protein ABF913_04740 [Oenococcus sp.]|uniref:hypothetical protein n=1 Tax=Oenococcus sp. TaxID=1979414 RepID=UPI0039E7A8B0